MVQKFEQENDQDAVYSWLEDAAKQRGLEKRVSAAFVRQDGKYLHFAVRLQVSGDAYDRAKVLQELEDAWDTEHPDSQWHLLLLPTGA